MEPYLRGVTVGPSSTTWSPGDGKIRRPRNGEDPRGVAAPLAGARTLGERTPVSLMLTYRGGAEGWVEISYGQGVCYVPHQAHIGDVVLKLIHGGHRVRPPKPARARRRT